MLANATGQAILDDAVTAATFRGPPILVVGDDLYYADDARWQAFLSTAAGLSAAYSSDPAPLIGLSFADFADLSLLDFGLARLSRFFDTSAARPYHWSEGGADFRPASPAGPVFAAPSEDSTLPACKISAWDLAARYARVTYSNYYGVGLFAIGPGDPEGMHGPPVYPLPAPSGIVTKLKTITEVWRRGGPSTLASYQTLIDLETDRFGISRRTHPALVPYVLLEEP